jgi:hypothetical protein
MVPSAVEVSEKPPAANHNTAIGAGVAVGVTALIVAVVVLRKRRKNAQLQPLRSEASHEQSLSHSRE